MEMLNPREFIEKLRKGPAYLLTADIETDPLIIAYRATDEGEEPKREEKLFLGPHPRSMDSDKYNEFLDIVKQIALERGL